MLKAKSGLELQLPETLDTAALEALGGEIADLSTHLAATYLR
jgi:hypothetical protein